MVEESLHRRLGLTDEEFERIGEILGRAPNRAELAMYSVMWSEHCSYKSSRMHLKTLPSEGPHVLIGPGEGAGVIEVDGVAVAMRIESHNHPSFVEPIQGAATGIGGVVRDVLSMGARPIALLDPLRFGGLSDAKNRFLARGVISGISSYGNCIGVPTVGGEIKFEDCYSGNPLVNVMCIGVAPKDRLMRARAHGPGNKVLLLGSKTGRDGIGGVSVLASATLAAGAADKRPSVQVGDPFTEKLVIEATLSLIEKGLVVGVQDLGGAGLCCATSESAASAGTGMRIDLDRVPLREPGLEPFEILTSESQERMLLVVKPEDVEEALGECLRLGAGVAVIGEVTTTGRLQVFQGKELVADVPAASLGDGPIYDRPAKRPDWLDGLQAEEIPGLKDAEITAAILTILASPSIASKRWAFEQYDHQVMLNTVVKPGADAAVLSVPGSKLRIAVTTDGNGRYCHLDPYLGAAHAVAEAYRNVSSTGAEPAAITNCLNFGSPLRPEVMWQFKEAVRGMGDACRALNVPVTGGNVSFYNESDSTGIFPTPIVGMVGVLGEGIDPPPMGFRNEGDVIMLIGATDEELGGSEYARTLFAKVVGRPPALDLEREAAAGGVIRKAVAESLLRSVHDLSEGGLAVALAEACVEGAIGAKVDLPENLSLFAWLFSETSSRYLVSIGEGSLGQLQVLLDAAGSVGLTLGGVGGSSLEIGSIVKISLADLKDAHEGSFASAIDPGVG